MMVFVPIHFRLDVDKGIPTHAQLEHDGDFV